VLALTWCKGVNVPLSWCMGKQKPFLSNGLLRLAAEPAFHTYTGGLLALAIDRASIPHVCWWDINTGNGWSQHLAQSHNAPDCLIAPPD